MLNYIDYPSWITPEVIPGLPIRWYGLMYLLAFATAFVLIRVQIRKKKLDITTDDLLNFLFWVIIGLLLGARIFSALIYEPDGSYLTRPWLIFWPFENGQFVGLQGMSYHGGLVGAIAGGLLFCWKHGHSPLLWADLTAVSAPLGYTFGRLGNFINGELYGRVSTAPFAMMFPNASRFPATESWVIETAEKVGIEITDPGMMVNLPRHPSQLYEAALEGIILWAILWFIVDRFARKPGIVTSAYITGYGIARFIAEYYRQPDVELGFIVSLTGDPGPIYLLNSFGDLSMGQLLSGIMVIAGIVLLLFFHFRTRFEPRIATYSGGGGGASRGGGKRGGDGSRGGDAGRKHKTSGTPAAGGNDRDEAASAARARRKRRNRK